MFAVLDFDILNTQNRLTDDYIFYPGVTNVMVVFTDQQGNNAKCEFNVTVGKYAIKLYTHLPTLPQHVHVSHKTSRGPHWTRMTANYEARRLCAA